VTQEQYSKPELDAGSSANPPIQVNPGPEYWIEATELDALSSNNPVNPTKTTPYLVASPPQASTPTTHTGQTNQGVGGNEESLALQQEVERVRAEREKLLRQQELSEME
jgi:hypothetical protein